MYDQSLHRGRQMILVIYLDPENHHLASITKADHDFTKRLDFKDIKFRVKLRDIQKLEKDNSGRICVFWL